MNRTTCRIIAALALAHFIVMGEPAKADDYSTLAGSLASPLFTSFEEANRGYTDAAVMVRMEIARQRLLAKNPESSEISGIYAKVLSHLDACHWSMDELRRLDAKTPDIEGLARKSLNAAPALARRDPDTGKLIPSDQNAVNELAGKAVEELVKAGVNAWQSSSERGKYRTSYRAARYAACDLATIAERHCTATRPVVYGVGIKAKSADNTLRIEEVIPGGSAAEAGLQSGDEVVSVDGTPIVRTDNGSSSIDNTAFLKLRGSYGSTTRLTFSRGGSIREVNLTRTFRVEETPVLTVDLNGSWDATFDSDYLYLRNDSGRDLTNCTIMVDLKGTHGENHSPNHDRLLHYLNRWPAGEWRIARYIASSGGGIASDESVDFLQTVTIDLYSDQVRNTIVYDYAGSGDCDKDIERYYSRNKPTFRLSFSKDNFFSNAGIWLTHDGGLSSFPDPNITAKVKQGSIEKTVRFRGNGKKWSSGYFGGESLKSEEFNGMDPDSIELTFEFPGTSFKQTLSWDLTKN